MAPSLHQPKVRWDRQALWALNSLLPSWEPTELTFALPTQCPVWLTNTVGWFPLPSSRFLKRACYRFWTPSQKRVSRRFFTLAANPDTKTSKIVLQQRSPNFLAPGTSFTEDNFSMNRGGGWFQDDSSVLCLLCTLFLLLLHCNI